MKTKEVTVWSSDEWDSKRPTNLVDFIVFLTEKVNSIPEEYRDTAEFHLYSDGMAGCTDSYAAIEVCYTRPRTSANRGM